MFFLTRNVNKDIIMLRKFSTIIIILLSCGWTTFTYPASDKVEIAEYENARKIDTVKAYKAFLGNYPESRWRDSAIYYRDRAALNKAKKIGTLKAINKFIKKYPESDWIEQAEYHKQYGVKK